MTGTDDFGRSVSAQDDHSVIIIHPAIKVEKTGESTAHEGQTVTYSFKVTNIGDVALFNINLNDDKLGTIGSLATLAVGESKTLTKDFTVPTGVGAVDNTATACGADPLALQVCGTDIHHLIVAQVLGERAVRPAPTLAVTGEDSQLRALVGMVALLGGLGLVLMRRRNRRTA